jgi:nitrite reductase/ring-hydroxylating ferredoxin subunit
MHTGSNILDSILNDGAYLIVSRVSGQEQVLEKTRGLLLDGVESLEGAHARRQLERRGLGALHEVLPADQIGALRDFVMPGIRPELLAFACRVGRDVLGIEGEFFVDDYTILRINYPYVVARTASATAENPGIGRVAERTRQEGKASRVVDPVYDPKGYHQNDPPPAWAHGAHQDTWTGHSRYGVNLWWAVDHVPEECGMVLYPEMFGRPLVADPRSLYLKEGQPLPKPTKMALRRGEMLIFNPELLHGTHLNTTNLTRLALSTRLNPRQPRFSPSCFYAREFWHSTSDLEAGRTDEIIRFKREENLEREETVGGAPEVAPPPGRRFVDLERPANGSWQEVCPSEHLAPGEKLVVRTDGADAVLVMRGTDAVYAIQPRCPHLRISLADGYHDDDTIWCPGHAVAFSLETGRSACDALRLKTYPIREDGGTIWLRRD